MFAGKPIIGLAGGIGAGKSFVADAFAAAGCVVIRSDELAKAAYDEPAVRDALRQWWGDGVFRPDGAVDRRAVADRVFADPAARAKLEALLHPIVEQRRQAIMRVAIGGGAELPGNVEDSRENDALPATPKAPAARSRGRQYVSTPHCASDRPPPHVPAFVWDSPLLFEAGLDRQCDRIVFVDAPEAVRLRRVAASRGWDAAELRRRENLQWPLDKKRAMAQDVISNTADGDAGPDDRGTGPGSPTELHAAVCRVLAALPARRT